VFSVDLRVLTKNEYLTIRFIKIAKHDLEHPIASSDIYVHSPLDSNLIKFENNHENEVQMKSEYFKNLIYF